MVVVGAKPYVKREATNKELDTLVKEMKLKYPDDC